jgi:radical SAM family uncharacterized protein
MRNLEDLVSRQLLPYVSMPGQYVGLEINRRHRSGFLPADDAAATSQQASFGVSIALAFPDTYAVGISHLGSAVLYHMLNDIPGVACDRTYCPTVEAEAVMRKNSVPLFGWESRCHLRDFDIVGFSLSYEICATNVLTMLHLAGIPLHAADRTQADPIIIAGDALADTPEPLADFIDLFVVGDGEGPLRLLVQLVSQMKQTHAGRDEIILEAARTIPSVYAPKFYQPRYDADGNFAGLDRLRDDVPAVIARAYLERMEQSPPISKPLVPLSQAIHERVVVEIMRGCPNACRFCQAGATRLPVRIRSVEEIIDSARAGLKATGYTEISLLSLSTSDYPRLDELIDRLNAEFAPQHVSISLPSLRVGSQLKQLPKLTSGVRKGGLTIAAEAGSDRLRQAIRKGISEVDMIEAVQAGYQAGLRSVKVYFMAGLPGETPEDIDEIYYLCRRLSDARKTIDNQRGAITASVSWFVPKPHTPMQWEGIADMDYFFQVRRQLKDLANRSPITFRFHRIERSILEAAICRGDRRMGQAIESAWQAGARMDSWDEHFNFDLWTQAFSQAGLDMNYFAQRKIPVGSAMPWSHIACYRDENFLAGEYQKMVDVLAGG